MGLDMYLDGEKFLWTNWENPSANPKEDGFDIKTKTLRIGYWRKHPNLHGFIVETFAEGKDECQEIGLSAEDIYTIMNAIKDGSLPHTTGFFFGKSEGTAEEAAEDLEIFSSALSWLETKEQGVSRSIIYRASW
jgi:hypothetical protein